MTPTEGTLQGKGLQTRSLLTSKPEAKLAPVGKGLSASELLSAQTCSLPELGQVGMVKLGLSADALADLAKELGQVLRDLYARVSRAVRVRARGLTWFL